MGTTGSNSATPSSRRGPGPIDVSVDGRTVSIIAERSAPTDAGDWLVAERPRGRYARQLTLGRDVDPENLHAACVDGVLTLTISFAEKAEPRRVTIEHGGGQARIEEGTQTREATS